MRKFLTFTAFLLLISVPAWAANATAIIKGTAANSPISGKVDLTDTPDGLKLSVDLHNVPPGKHAFHIHENGACGDMGKAAGAHYNPDKNPHGDVFKNGVEHAHAGDLGNLTVSASGSGKFETMVPGLTVSGGKYPVLGHAFILHENVDDFTQPAGNAGGRIACGVIEAS